MYLDVVLEAEMRLGLLKTEIPPARDGFIERNGPRLISGEQMAFNQSLQDASGAGAGCCRSHGPESQVEQ